MTKLNLSAIETEILRLGQLYNTYTVIANGAEFSSKEELVSAVCYVQGSLEDILVNMEQAYRILKDTHQ